MPILTPIFDHTPPRKTAASLWCWVILTERQATATLFCRRETTHMLALRGIDAAFGADMQLRNRLNQQHGQSFERMLEFAARLQRVLLMRNGQEVRCLPGGKLVRQKSQVDYTLVANGQVAFFDAKAFAGDYFTYSMLPARQLTLCLDYAQHGARSGFVVHFRQRAEVCFFDARYISLRGPKSRFVPDDGFRLGNCPNLYLAAIFLQSADKNRAIGPVGPNGSAMISM